MDGEVVVSRALQAVQQIKDSAEGKDVDILYEKLKTFLLAEENTLGVNNGSIALALSALFLWFIKATECDEVPILAIAISILIQEMDKVTEEEIRQSRLEANKKLN